MAARSALRDILSSTPGAHHTPTMKTFVAFAMFIAIGNAALVPLGGQGGNGGAGGTGTAKGTGNTGGVGGHGGNGGIGLFDGGDGGDGGNGVLIGDHGIGGFGGHGGEGGDSILFGKGGNGGNGGGGALSGNFGKGGIGGNGGKGGKGGFFGGNGGDGGNGGVGLLEGFAGTGGFGGNGGKGGDSLKGKGGDGGHGGFGVLYGNLGYGAFGGNGGKGGDGRGGGQGGDGGAALLIGVLGKGAEYAEGLFSGDIGGETVVWCRLRESLVGGRKSEAAAQRVPEALPRVERVGLDDVHARALRQVLQLVRVGDDDEHALAGARRQQRDLRHALLARRDRAQRHGHGARQRGALGAHRRVGERHAEVVAQRGARRGALAHVQRARRAQRQRVVAVHAHDALLVPRLRRLAAAAAGRARAVGEADRLHVAHQVALVLVRGERHHELAAPPGRQRELVRLGADGGRGRADVARGAEHAREAHGLRGGRRVARAHAHHHVVAHLDARLVRQLEAHALGGRQRALVGGRAVGQRRALLGRALRELVLQRDVVAAVGAHRLGADHLAHAARALAHELELVRVAVLPVVQHVGVHLADHKVGVVLDAEPLLDGLDGRGPEAEHAARHLLRRGVDGLPARQVVAVGRALQVVAAHPRGAPHVKVPRRVARAVLDELAVAVKVQVDGAVVRAVGVVRGRKVGDGAARHAQRAAARGQQPGKHPALAVAHGRALAPELGQDGRRAGPRGGRRAVGVLAVPAAHQHAAVVLRVDGGRQVARHRHRVGAALEGQAFHQRDGGQEHVALEVRVVPRGRVVGLGRAAPDHAGGVADVLVARARVAHVHGVVRRVRVEDEHKVERRVGVGQRVGADGRGHGHVEREERRGGGGGGGGGGGVGVGLAQRPAVDGGARRQRDGGAGGRARAAVGGVRMHGRERERVGRGREGERQPAAQHQRVGAVRRGAVRGVHGRHVGGHGHGAAGRWMGAVRRARGAGNGRRLLFVFFPLPSPNLASAPRAPIGPVVRQFHSPHVRPRHRHVEPLL
ncbi:Annulin [Gracilaria domingensis]|nr:Annulin [Gracilaria domingensis]